MFYSKSTNGFYDSEIHGSNIPKDAVEISKDLWNSLLDQQANGKSIKADKSGKPIAVDRPKKTKDEIISTYQKVAQLNLDSVAQSWGYESMIMALSYINSTNKQYKAEAKILNEWRDNYWAAAYTITDGSVPDTVEDFMAMLPEAPIKP